MERAQNEEEGLKILSGDIFGGGWGNAIDNFLHKRFRGHLGVSDTREIPYAVGFQQFWEPLRESLRELCAPSIVFSLRERLT